MTHSCCEQETHGREEMREEVQTKTSEARGQSSALRQGTMPPSARTIGTLSSQELELAHPEKNATAVAQAMAAARALVKRC